MVHREEVRVTKVHPDGPHREPEAPWTPPDDDWRLEGVYKRRDVPAGRGVPTTGSATTPRALDNSTSTANSTS